MKKIPVTIGLCLAAAASATNPAEAASVRAVSAAKNMVALDLDDGEAAAKGEVYCVFSKSDKKVECGKVVKLKGTVAVIALRSGAKIGAVKKGLAARKKDGGGSEEEAKGDEAVSDGEKPERAEKSSKKKNPLRIWVFANPAVAAPASFNQISYKAPDGTGAPATLWQANKAPTLIPFSFGAQIAIPVGKKAVAVGGRMRKWDLKPIDSDYTVNQLNPYASTAMTASALGFWAEYQVVHKAMSPSVFFNLSPGLDMDVSTVTVAATKKNDSAPDSGDIVTASSKLTLISLRVASNFDVFLGKSFGLSLGGTAIVPLIPMSAVLKADFPINEDRGSPIAVDDLKAVLGHKKGLGLEAFIAAFFAF